MKATYSLPELKPGSFPKLVYGLAGIMQIFDVSKATACRYKNTILKNAVTQQGNVIICDVERALGEFGVKDPGRFVVG